MIGDQHASIDHINEFLYK